MGRAAGEIGFLGSRKRNSGAADACCFELSFRIWFKSSLSMCETERAAEDFLPFLRSRYQH